LLDLGAERQTAYPELQETQVRAERR